MLFVVGRFDFFFLSGASLEFSRAACFLLGIELFNACVPEDISDSTPPLNAELGIFFADLGICTADLELSFDECPSDTCLGLGLSKSVPQEDMSDKTLLFRAEVVMRFVSPEVCFVVLEVEEFEDLEEPLESVRFLVTFRRRSRCEDSSKCFWG